MITLLFFLVSQTDVLPSTKNGVSVLIIFILLASSKKVQIRIKQLSRIKIFILCENASFVEQDIHSQYLSS